MLVDNFWLNEIISNGLEGLLLSQHLFVRFFQVAPLSLIFAEILQVLEDFVLDDLNRVLSNAK